MIFEEVKMSVTKMVLYALNLFRHPTMELLSLHGDGVFHLQELKERTSTNLLISLKRIIRGVKNEFSHFYI